MIVYFTGDKVQRLALYNVPRAARVGPGRQAPITKFSYLFDLARPATAIGSAAAFFGVVAANGSV